jgi:hypothetical protein
VNEEEIEIRKDAVRKELSRLMQEWLNLTDSNDGPNGLLTACVISFEGTRFNDEGDQVYRTDHIVVPPTSYSASVGILNETLWQIHHNGFTHCHGGS